MTFRNDHDAALARVDSLEAEVAALHAQLAEERAEVRRLEEFIGLRDELVPDDPQDITARIRETDDDDPVGIGLTVAVLFAFGLFVLAAVMA